MVGVQNLLSTCTQHSHAVGARDNAVRPILPWLSACFHLRAVTRTYRQICYAQHVRSYVWLCATYTETVFYRGVLHRITVHLLRFTSTCCKRTNTIYHLDMIPALPRVQRAPCCVPLTERRRQGRFLVTRTRTIPWASGALSCTRTVCVTACSRSEFSYGGLL